MRAVPRIPRRILFGTPDKTSVQLSPGGTHLACFAPRDGVLSNRAWTSISWRTTFNARAAWCTVFPKSKRSIGTLSKVRDPIFCGGCAHDHRLMIRNLIIFKWI